MTESSPLPMELGTLYLNALNQALPLLSDLQRGILRVLIGSPDHTTSAGQLARELGVHHVTVNSEFANMGLKVVGLMGMTADEALRLYPRHWQILALKGVGSTAKTFLWQLRPEVVEALEILGFTDASDLARDERIVATTLTEGAPSVSKETLRRNAVARELCLSYHEPICKVCGMDFRLTYGAEFRDCIHVHHLNPMAQATGLRVVNPNTDLVPVCPNCHAVIHAHDELRTLDAVRALMQSKQQK